MIVITSREENELLKRLRALGPLSETSGLTAEVLTLKRQIQELEISKAKIIEEQDTRERELRHMIGLEKKRQEVEIEQAKRETALSVREENLKADKARFEEQLSFNTKRFETMEQYLKGMLTDILGRLPNVNMRITREEKSS